MKSFDLKLIDFKPNDFIATPFYFRTRIYP